MLGYPRTGLPTVKYATGSWPSSIRSSPLSVRTVAYLTPQPASIAASRAPATMADQCTMRAWAIAASAMRGGFAPQPRRAAHARRVAVHALHEARAHRLVAHAAG